MDINEIASQIRVTAIAHGWEDEAREDGTWIALAHSELSEALEVLRERPRGETWNRESDGKPEGVLTELADCVIRCLHHMQHIIDESEVTINGVALADLEAAGYHLTPGSIIYDKMQFNEHRPFKHGGKAF